MTDRNNRYHQKREFRFDGDQRKALHWFCSAWQLSSLREEQGSAEALDPEEQAPLTLVPGLKELELALLVAAFRLESLVVSGEDAQAVLLTKDARGMFCWNGGENPCPVSRTGGEAELPPVCTDMKADRRIDNSALIRYLLEEPAFAGAEISAWYVGDRAMRPYCGNDGRIMLLTATAPGGKAVLLHHTTAQRLVIAAREEISKPQLDC